MKIKLTLASSKDRKPTINSSYFNNLSTEVLYLELVVNGVYTCNKWHLSRNNRTYYADSWMCDLPVVGNPLICELISYKIIFDNPKKLKLELK